MDTKNEIFARYGKEYWVGSKERKSAILDSIADVTGMHRKAIIRAMRRVQVRDRAIPERRGRKTYYGADVNAALNDIWKAAHHICGELLHPMIGEYVAILERDGMWMHGDETTGKLLAISERTLKRRIGRMAKDARLLRGRGSTVPSQLKTIVPVYAGSWRRKAPGHGQIDTVVHCGEWLIGDMVYTLNYTDIAVCWTIPRAQWNKGETVTQGNLDAIRTLLPWTLLEAHADSGSEFLNWHMVHWCDDNDILLTRSRSGKKNDNAHVEERNGHIVRKFVGYRRLDCPEAVDALNQVYAVLAMYLNHFIPVRKSLGKERVGSRYRRIYEKVAQTPYQRVLAHTEIAGVVKEKLRAEHATLNPLTLSRELDTLIGQLFTTQEIHGNRMRPPERLQ